MNIQDEPLHSGEIFHMWSYLENSKADAVTLQVFINQTTDKDLKALLEDILENCILEEIQQVEGILKELGIRLPSAPPDRPNVELHDIPAGARFNDSEIAMLVKKEFIYSKSLCSYITSISHQEYIQLLFSDLHKEKIEYEQKLHNLSKQKGWITSPPISIK